MKTLFSFALIACLWMFPPAAMAHEDKDQHPLKPSPRLRVPSPQPPVFQPLTGSERFNYYLHHTFGPLAIARSTVWSGINQAADTPSEWGQGMKGYGRRLADKLGQHAIKDSIQDGMAALFHEDPRYIPSRRNGIGSRTAYALEHAFLVYRNDGTTKFADSHLIAAFGTAAISRTWYPQSHRTVGGTLEAGAISYGVDAGMAVVREFWPDIQRRISSLFR